MVKVIYDGAEYECSKAARSDDEVVMYDDENRVLNRISGIIGDEWNYISIEDGEWLDINDMPTTFDMTKSDIDYLIMANDFLLMENDILRADLDYCLMLLEG